MNTDPGSGPCEEFLPNTDPGTDPYLDFYLNTDPGPGPCKDFLPTTDSRAKSLRHLNQIFSSEHCWRCWKRETERKKERERKRETERMKPG